MATIGPDPKRREEMSRIHGEIWEAAISPGFKRANDLLDTKATKPPEHLLHFTSAAALSKILPNCTLRLGRARASNDPKELDHGLSLARQEQDKVTKDVFDQAFREELLASFAGRLANGTERRGVIDPHICCFTETDSADQVPHWAMYGRDGSGFALRFRSDALTKAQGVGLVKITYDEEVQREHLREVLAVARATSQEAHDYAKGRHGDGWAHRSFRVAANAFGGIVSLHAATMKAPEFASEKEWRLVHTGIGEDGGKPSVEARGAMLYTYFETKFSPEDLVSVVVGPVYADLNRPVVARLLFEHGYTTTALETGKVALRALRDR